MSKSRPKQHVLDPDGRCPICRQWFKDCSHTVVQAEGFLFHRHLVEIIRKIVRQELQRMKEQESKA